MKALAHYPWTLRNRWSGWHFAYAVLLAAFAVFATLNAWMDIWNIALREEEMSHILLVPLVAAWLVWVRRLRWRQCRRRGLAVGPILVAIGWLLWELGDGQLIEACWHLGAVLVVIGSVLSVLGTDVALKFLPALVVLLFLVPVPGRVREALALPLQNAAADVTQRILAGFGANVDRSGNLLTINGMDVAVAEACNGLRMVFALTLVAFAFAFGTPLLQYARVLIVLISPLLALLTNIARLIVTVWIYGNLPTHFAEPFHDVSGWLMLPLGLLLLIATIRLLRWAMIPVTPFVLAED